MNSTPAPGWYPDPAGAPQQRWWNGSTWSDSVQATAVASPFGAVQPYGAAVQPYAPLQPYGTGQPQQSYYGQALQAPEGTNPSTPQFWIFALAPLLILVNLVIYVLLGGLDAEYLTGATTNSFADLVDGALAVVGWLAMVPVAYLDSRELLRRGVQRPFGWGWAFVPIVYVIGRSSVVYSRTRRGLAPLFVWIAAVIVGRVLVFAFGFVAGLAQMDY